MTLPGGFVFSRVGVLTDTLHGTGISVQPDLTAVTKEHPKSQDLSAMNLLEKAQQLLWPLHIEFVIL